MSDDLARFLRMTRHFDAAPERVFDAWLDPEMARQWLFASPKDESYAWEADPRVGGTYRITVRRDGQDYTGLGEYLEIERPRRLVFTFAMPQFSASGSARRSESGVRPLGGSRHFAIGLGRFVAPPPNPGCAIPPFLRRDRRAREVAT